MPTFGKLSQARLATCDERLRLVMQEAIRTSPVDFTVTCGHRGQEEQDKAVREGKSKTPWPSSRHNSDPSEAVDVCPYRNGVGLVWNDHEAWSLLASHIKATAARLGIAIEWGGDWHKFIDKPHFQLKRG